MPHLEDFRYNESASSYFTIPGHSDRKIYKSYERFAAMAFYDTFRDISNLENSRMFMVHNGSHTLSSLSLWFLTLESYVLALVKICCRKFELNFEEYRRLSLTQRVQALLDILELDKKAFNESDIIGKIHEFSRFRNGLFHEKGAGEELVFHKTKFTPVPILSNQADTFQALLIVLEVTQRFRNIFPGINSMPLVPLVNGGLVVEEQLDKCYANVLLPSFRFALRKHDLTIELDLDPARAVSAPSPRFKKGEVESLAVAERYDGYLPVLNHELTTNCLTTFNNYITSCAAAEDQAKMPKVVME